MEQQGCDLGNASVWPTEACPDSNNFEWHKNVDLKSRITYLKPIELKFILIYAKKKKSGLLIFSWLLHRWFSNFRLHQNHREGLRKGRLPARPARVSDSAGSGSGPRVCISNKFPGDTDSGVWGAHFENRTSVLQKEKSFLVTVSLCKGSTM